MGRVGVSGKSPFKAQAGPKVILLTHHIASIVLPNRADIIGGLPPEKNALYYGSDSDGALVMDLA